LEVLLITPIGSGATIITMFMQFALTFTINAPYDVNLNLGQGKNGSVSFIAKDPGIFRYYCEYHESTMNGQLVVIPK
jgi:plastocyanin